MDSESISIIVVAAPEPTIPDPTPAPSFDPDLSILIPQDPVVPLIDDDVV